MTNLALFDGKTQNINRLGELGVSAASSTVLLNNSRAHTQNLSQK